jgi:hypothetical protein
MNKQDMSVETLVSDIERAALRRLGYAQIEECVERMSYFNSARTHHLTGGRFWVEFASNSSEFPTLRQLLCTKH